MERQVVSQQEEEERGTGVTATDGERVVAGVL